MCRYLYTLSAFFLFISCNKKKINCEEKFNLLYEKRFSLWYAMDRNEIKSNDNFTEKEYQNLKKGINDSLQITIDCALEMDKKNQILYLYKMKQLYLSGKLNSINSFFKTIDKKLINKDIYFQLSLYNFLSLELLSGNKQIIEYNRLKEYYFVNKINIEYKNRATEEFLNYLIKDNIDSFKLNLLKKYPNSNSMSLQYENNRQSIIKEIMIRGDGLVFD